MLSFLTGSIALALNMLALCFVLCAIVCGIGMYRGVQAYKRLEAAEERVGHALDLLNRSPYSLTRLSGLAYDTARNKGWHDKPREPGTILMLMVSELAEACEEWRDGRDLTTTRYGDDGKPEGYPIELADVLIRIFNHAGEIGIDLDRAVVDKMTYNERRPYRHGGKVA